MDRLKRPFFLALWTISAIGLSLWIQPAFSQETVLFGYSLGDHQENILAQLGNPGMVQETENELHWIFFLGKEETNYIVFSFSKSGQNILTGIQVTGPGPLKGSLMKGIRLGDEREKVERVFGSPDVVDRVEDIGGILCRYSNRNYSFEFVNNKLYSVRIHRRVYLPQLAFYQHLTL